MQGTINDESTGDVTGEETATVEEPVIGDGTAAGNDGYDATSEATATDEVLADLIAQFARECLWTRRFYLREYWCSIPICHTR